MFDSTGTNANLKEEEKSHPHLLFQNSFMTGAQNILDQSLGLPFIG